MIPVANKPNQPWNKGTPPDDVEIAWLRLECHHQEGESAYVVLGCRSLEDNAWCIAADWKGEAYNDPVEDAISHWMAYVIPTSVL
jgi:hypothetical protein